MRKLTAAEKNEMWGPWLRSLERRHPGTHFSYSDDEPGVDTSAAARFEEQLESERAKMDRCEFCAKQLLTIPQACSYLGISTSKGYELLHAGEFPVSARRIGSQWRISKAELDEWLRTPQGSPSDPPQRLAPVRRLAP